MLTTAPLIAQALHFYQNMRKACDRADEHTLEAREPEQDMLAFVRDQLITGNPWEILDSHMKKISNGLNGDRALVMLLEDAAATASRSPELKAQLLPELRHMAEVITQAAKVAIDTYNMVTRDNAKARVKDKKPLLPGFRPADIYRRFARPLRWLVKQDYVSAEAVLRDILLVQSLPFEELDAPAWIDQYTLEVDPNSDKPGDLKVRFTEPVMKTDLAERIQMDLGWDEETVKQFLVAQEGFDSEDDLEGLLNAVDEDKLTRPDDRVPNWMEMQEDCHPTKDLPSIRAEAQPWIAACRALIDQLVKEANGMADMEDKYWRVQAFKHVKDGFRSSAEARDFLGFLNEKAEEGVSPADLGPLFLSLQHGYGFDEHDAVAVRLHYVPNFRNLDEWLDFWGDELLEAMHDAPSHSKEPTREELDQFAEETLQQIIQHQASAQTSSIFRTAPFMEGYIRAMMNANRVTAYTDGVRHNLAIEAGWDAWRQWKSAEGNKAYHLAKNRGAAQKEAMTAFWQVVNQEHKRAQNGTIVGVKTTGLQLSNGRFVDWNVALLKLKNNELNLNPESRARLKDALTSKGVGGVFALAL